MKRVVFNKISALKKPEGFSVHSIYARFSIIVIVHFRIYYSYKLDAYLYSPSSSSVAKVNATSKVNDFLYTNTHTFTQISVRIIRVCIEEELHIICDYIICSNEPTVRNWSTLGENISIQRVHYNTHILLLLLLLSMDTDKMCFIFNIII